MASLRVLRFVRHLDLYGWSVDVLTADRRRHRVLDLDLERNVPADTGIFRESASREGPGESRPPAPRNSSVLPSRFRPGGFLKAVSRISKDWIPLLAEPRGWARSATAAGLDLVRSGRYACLFSSSGPLACHVVAYALARATDIPWVADFRDAMADNPYAHRPTPWHEHYFASKELRIVKAADVVTVTTRTHADLLARRYGW